MSKRIDLVGQDPTIARLSWYFRDSAGDAEVAFLLGAMAVVHEDIPSDAYDVDAITRHRETRNILLSLDQPHADVLAWMFEERDYPARVASLFAWPGVAVRTFAAQWALACAGSEPRVMTTDGQVDVGDAWPGRGPLGFVPVYKDGQPTGHEVQADPVAQSPRRTGKLERVASGDFHRWLRPRPKDVPENERAHGEAMLAFLSGFKDREDPIVKAIADETKRRVYAAMDAYEAARKATRVRRAA